MDILTFKIIFNILIENYGIIWEKYTVISVEKTCLHIIFSILFIPNNILLFIIFLNDTIFYFCAFVSFRSFPNNYWDKFVKRKVILIRAL